MIKGLSAAAAFALLATASLAGATSHGSTAHQLAVARGVIRACVETRGDAATIGDLKLSHCHRGFKRLSWNVRGRLVRLVRLVHPALRRSARFLTDRPSTV